LQILARNNRYRKDGGESVLSDRKQKIKLNNKELKMQRRFGCSIKFRKSLSDDIVLKFRKQRVYAKTRGIPWELSLYDWWNLWKDKWNNRGRNHGQYVMSRKGDTGPYSINNIKIVTNTENILEIYEIKYGKDYSQTKQRLYIKT